MEKVIKNKNSSIELLRIISMLFIVISHYFMWGSFYRTNYEVSTGNMFIASLLPLGSISVIIFVLITGYFSINKTKNNYSKIIRLILEVTFYSLGIYLILLALNKVEFSVYNLITALFPVIFNEYWFFTSYIVLYLAIPYLNKYLENKTKGEYIFFMVIVYLISLILNLVIGFNYKFIDVSFFSIYALGSYLRKFNDNVFENKKKNLIIFVSALLIFCLANVLNTFIFKSGYYLDFLVEKNSPLTYFLAVPIFVWFKNLTIKNTKVSSVINYISPSVFGVYLIHENPHLKYIIWLDIYHTNSYLTSSYMWVHFLFTVITLMLVCLVIEEIRKWLFYGVEVGLKKLKLKL